MDPQPIYTIGHGARPIRQFLDLLEKYSIAFLVDVRSIPYSKYHPQFRKEDLSDAVRARGIRYIYLGDLLGARPFNASLFKIGIRRLVRASGQCHRVAIMCSESNPGDCHRDRLIAPALMQANVPVLHIDEKGELIPPPFVLLFE
jgi:uncharacterized protein (DUF488 family)